MTKEEFILKAFYEAKGSDFYEKAKAIELSVGYKRVDQENHITVLDHERDAIRKLLRYIDALNTKDKINTALFTILLKVAVNGSVDEMELEEIIK